MKVQTFGSGTRLLFIIFSVVWTITFAGIARAQDDERISAEYSRDLSAVRW